MYILSGDDKFEHRYLSTIIEMQDLLMDRYNLYTPRYLIAQAWERYSYSMAAGFMHFDANDSWDVMRLMQELGVDHLHEISQEVKDRILDAPYPETNEEE